LCCNSAKKKLESVQETKFDNKNDVIEDDDDGCAALTQVCDTYMSYKYHGK